MTNNLLKMFFLRFFICFDVLNLIKCKLCRINFSLLFDLFGNFLFVSWLILLLSKSKLPGIN